MPRSTSGARSPDPDARLPAAPRLRPAAPRSGRPRIGRSLAEIDAVAGESHRRCRARRRARDRPVRIRHHAGSTPVHVNRALREAGLLQRPREAGGEMLDVPQSRAFAVADHQVAHVYVAEPQPGARCGAGRRPARRRRVLDRAGKRASRSITALRRIRRARAAGRMVHLLLLARRPPAPDFARTVEIHRKPGYDPVELFLDPAIRFPKLAIGWRLARRALGFRTLMDVIPLDATLVKGSHGRLTDDSGRSVVHLERSRLRPTDRSPLPRSRTSILAHVFDDARTPALPIARSGDLKYSVVIARTTQS